MARKDVTVSRNGSDRATIEARRGIVRDEAGKILRSKEWKVARKAYLQEKLEDCARRAKNIKAELKTL